MAFMLKQVIAFGHNAYLFAILLSTISFQMIEKYSNASLHTGCYGIYISPNCLRKTWSFSSSVSDPE
jgi:hypothetical protein